MRAFAKQIGLGQSALSQVLAGKKNLSLERGAQVASELGLSGSEAEYFRSLLLMENTKNLKLKSELLTQVQSQNPSRPVREYSVDMFSVIADWYHLVIKNMVGLKGFEFTPENISKTLGLSKIEVEVAIERLLRLEVIEPDSKQKGKYKKVDDYIMIRSNEASEALRTFHRQMLEKAIISLAEQTPKEKFVGSETFAISQKQLPKAFALADEFLTQMSKLSQETTHPTMVYHLGVQFFNMMKNERKPE